MEVASLTNSVAALFVQTMRPEGLAEESDEVDIKRDPKSVLRGECRAMMIRLKTSIRRINSPSPILFKLPSIVGAFVSSNCDTDDTLENRRL